MQFKKYDGVIWRVISRYVLCLHCLYLTIFPSSLLACNVGLWESHILVSNSKFMEWLCYVLEWSWSLLPAYGIYFPFLLLLLLFLFLFLLLLSYDDWAKVSLPISCASHRLEQFICEKSHLLHAPPWSLLTCDVIFTWLQNLVESLRSTLALFCSFQICWWSF